MSLADSEKYDELLMTVAGQCGGIQPLLDVFFSFLYRRTDFFHVMQEGDKMGFPEGVAEKIVLRAFKAYEQQAGLAAKKAPAAPAPPPASKPPAAKPPPAKAKAPAAAPAAPPAAAPVADAAAAASTADGAAAKPAAAKPAHLSEATPYNGGRTARYTWEQTLGDVTIQVPVAAGTRARDVVCVIGAGHLRVGLKGQPPVLDDDFPCDARNGQEIWEKVKTAESYWNVDAAAAGGQTAVVVYLEKERESWWKSALHTTTTAEEIDTTKVDSTRSLYEYDGETQGAIRKIMFDQEQKRKGLPTSDELKNEDMLRKAWDAEGSPFKGTPFDPSMINFNGSGDGSGAMPPGMEGLPGGLPPLPGAAAAEEDEEPRIQEVDG